MMKNRIKSIFFLTVVLFSAQACKDDVVYNDTGLYPVERLISPDDELDLELINSEHAVLQFEWEAPRAGITQNYSVVFYGGEGGREIYRVQSNELGQGTVADITHDELTKAAKLAGIEPEETGIIQWNVVASRGTSEVKPTAANRRIILTRYPGFDETPVNVYIYGEATDGGTDYDKAQRFYPTDDGVFEIYTRLDAGKGYQFINRRNAGDKRTFYIGEDDQLLEADLMTEAENGGVFRITLDFNTGRAQVQEVTQLVYYHSATETREQLVYDEAGVWKSGQFNIPNDGDTRYFFYITVDGVVEKLGHRENDTQEIPDVLTGEYYDIYHYDPYVNQWRYWNCYKMNSELLGASVSMIVNLNAEEGQYNHTIDVGDYTPGMVPGLNSPADGYVADLFSMRDTPLTFDWNPGAQLGTLPLRYEVVFYSDPECTHQIILQDEVTFEDITFTSGNGGLNTDMTFSAGTLQSISEKTTAGDDGNTTVYWTVRSRILSYRSPVPDAVHKLIIKPVAVPVTLALSGSDTEYGNTPQLLHRSGTEFDIYTRVTGSDYTFTDENGRVFYVNASYDIDVNGPTAIALNGIYKITLDMISWTVKMEEINNIWFHSIATDTHIELQYQGKGIWAAYNQATNYLHSEWGGDDRVKICPQIDGVEHKYGPSSDNFWGENDYNTYLGPGEDPRYWVYDVPNNNDYAYFFKIWSGAGYRNTSGKRMSVTLNLAPDTPNYYTYFEYPDA